MYLSILDNHKTSHSLNVCPKMGSAHCGIGPVYNQTAGDKRSNLWYWQPAHSCFLFVLAGWEGLSVKTMGLSSRHSSQQPYGRTATNVLGFNQNTSHFALCGLINWHSWVIKKVPDCLTVKCEIWIMARLIWDTVYSKFWVWKDTLHFIFFFERLQLNQSYYLPVFI